MKVVCKQNTAKKLNLKEVTSIFSNEARYPLTIEKEYIVMGIAIYKDSNCIYYLVDNGSRPDWVPYMLFEISDNAFPPNWHINIVNKEKYPQSDVFSLFGFYELCKDEVFYDALVEREPEALEIYRKRKHEFQEWYTEREEAKKFYPEEAKRYYSIND